MVFAAPRVGVGVAWSQAGPRSVNPKTQVRRSADLGWRAGGSEESSSCWGPSGHHLGRTRLRKEPAGSRDGQGGKQETFGYSHATFRHRLLGTPLLKDAALPWRGGGRREGLCFRHQSFFPLPLSQLAAQTSKPSSHSQEDPEN